MLARAAQISRTGSLSHGKCSNVSKSTKVSKEVVMLVSKSPMLVSKKDVVMLASESSLLVSKSVSILLSQTKSEVNARAVFSPFDVSGNVSCVYTVSGNGNVSGKSGNVSGNV